MYDSVGILQWITLHKILRLLSRLLSVVTAIFPGGPGLVGTSMTLFWTLLELSLMEVVSGVTTVPVRRAKL